MSLSNLNLLPIEYIMPNVSIFSMLLFLGFIQVIFFTIRGRDHKIYAFFLWPKSSFIRKAQSTVQLKEKKTEGNDTRVCLFKGDVEVVFKCLGLFSGKFLGGNFTCGKSTCGVNTSGESGNSTCRGICTTRFKCSMETCSGDCSACEVTTEKSPLFSSSEFQDAKKREEILDSEGVSKLFEEDGAEEAAEAAVAKEEEVKAAFDVYDENKDGFIDEFELQRVLCGLGFKEGLEIDNCKKMIILADTNGDGMLDLNEFVNFLENSFQIQ